MRVAFGTERATDVSGAVKAKLVASGHEIIATDEGLGWAEIGLAVGHSVATGQADCGIAFCGNGVGVTMAANKVAGARAALCAEPAVACAARKFNEANVLTLGLESVSADAAVQILDAFLATEPDGSEADQVRALAQAEPRILRGKKRQ
jgi:ribose 5-phosphate isomerase B